MARIYLKEINDQNVPTRQKIIVGENLVSNPNQVLSFSELAHLPPMHSACDAQQFLRLALGSHTLWSTLS